MAEGGRLRNPRHFFEQGGRFRKRETAQQDGAFFELLSGEHWLTIFHLTIIADFGR